MSVIRIQELEPAAQAPASVSVQVSLGKTKLPPRILRHPLNSFEQSEINWYFEQYQNEPYETEVRIKQCEQFIVEAGERLFLQLFSQPSELEEYQRFMQRYTRQDIFIEIEGNSVAFQSIPWEHLKDPQQANPLSINGVHLLRRTGGHTATTIRRSVDKLRMLLVTARPGFEKDVNPRTIQRPVVQLLHSGRLPVEVTILRPGTLPALLEHLDRQDRKSPYDIIHFDLHGAVKTYDQLREERDANRLQFRQFSFGAAQMRVGVAENIAPYEGKRAYLFFEGNEINKPIPVGAEEIAAVLEAQNIPVCIFNACQSASQHDADVETSLGKVLVTKIPNVLALRYSVSTDAARLLIEVLYDHLFDGEGLEKAVTKARKKLFQDRNRSARYDKTISMSDWVLPVMYSVCPVVFRQKKKNADETIEAERDIKAARFVESRYGFHGRDLDVMSIERFFVLPPKRHLLLRGLRGSGVSTFLRYLAYWWEKTSFVAHSIYLDAKDSIVQKHPEILYDALADKLLISTKRATFDLLPTIVKRKQLLQILNSERCALMIDHLVRFESEDFIRFLNDITGESIVIHTATVESGLSGEATLRERHYFLRGLDENAAASLGNRILSNEKGDKTLASISEEPMERFALNKLLRLLDGHPSAMIELLPKLQNQPASEVLKEYEQDTVKSYPE